RDGVKLHRRSTCGTNAFLYLCREATQMEIARHGFNPSVSDPDQRLSQVFARETNGFEHGTRRCPVAPFCDKAAAVFQIHRLKRLRQRAAKRKPSAGLACLCTSGERLPLKSGNSEFCFGIERSPFFPKENDGSTRAYFDSSGLARCDCLQLRRRCG